ncbi:asparagine synthase-related protein [Rhodopirellula sallentina]|uniref:Asparagine synthase (Glutamine-hydrolyzing) n=1 Tax=Rhodopirellula sallentina SM41 TaxID=1263870 RepID=M5TW13_9BACT|nr:asparagine synthase-related protein [Rhodopirellula sallentina]EMI53365.1 asparagine synthase (glutamine-hydrolyzing) [Rhodopirellula sallentina SM41]
MSDQKFATVERLVNLLDPESNVIFNMSIDDAIERVGTGEPDRVREIDGQFALVHKNGKIVRLARSIGRPMRYFLAKQAAGPVLVIAERMDEIRDYLEEEGIVDQFHPSYTRMVPAHYVTELSLVGCPDPNPIYTRYLTQYPNELPADIDEIGRAYIGALSNEIDRWIDSIPEDAPIGVLFSGGVDSGAVLTLSYHSLLKRGQNAQRLKAFTLTVNQNGSDLVQASEFLKSLDIDYLLEPVQVDAASLDYKDAIRTIEDYKPLDVQAATMAIAVLREIRNQFPDWKYLLDGDGGDENLRDYPIEENPELTIRSVLGNPFFYHEGWGVDKIKHSQTYSGGQSRGHVRTYATAARFGFEGFSPFATSNVIEVAEKIPFIDLTNWDHEKLYALKGSVTRAGVHAITGLNMPVFEKNRFQRGTTSEDDFSAVFPENPMAYRQAFAEIFNS